MRSITLLLKINVEKVPRYELFQCYLYIYHPIVGIKNTLLIYIYILFIQRAKTAATVTAAATAATTTAAAVINNNNTIEHTKHHKKKNHCKNKRNNNNNKQQYGHCDGDGDDDIEVDVIDNISEIHEWLSNSVTAKGGQQQ